MKAVWEMSSGADLARLGSQKEGCETDPWVGIRSEMGRGCIHCGVL